MITRHPDPPIQYLSTPSPEPSPRGSLPSAEFDSADESSLTSSIMDAMDTTSDDGTAGGQMSLSQTNLLNPTGPYCARLPTLQEILSNRAPPPWTLAAFTAYLSQNHCLENLEFITEAERYRKQYAAIESELTTPPRSPESNACREVRTLWVRLLDAYIRPNAPREVNLSGNVRDALVALSNEPGVPPPPSSLDRATERIVELMNESILLTFISEHAPQRPASTGVDGREDTDERHARHSSDTERQRSRSRRKQSPVGDVLGHAHRHSGPSRTSHHSHSSSSRPHVQITSPTASHAPENALTDDTGSSGSPTNSPMTPPTTPPSSDLGGTSPRNRTDNAWRKMFTRMQRPRRD